MKQRLIYNATEQIFLNSSEFAANQRTVLTTTLLEGLISVWDMTEPSGTVMNDSTGFSDGTIGVDVTLNSGSYTFIRDWDSKVMVDEPRKYMFAGPFSFNVWVNPASNSSWSVDGQHNIITIKPVNQGGNVSLVYACGQTSAPYLSTSFVGIGGGNASALTSTGMAYGTGYMITSTFDGTNIKMYVNSVDRTTSALAYDGSNPVFGASTITIGSYFDGSAYLKANLNQLAIWGRALSQTEINQLYNSGAGLAYSSWPAGLKS